MVEADILTIMGCVEKKNHLVWLPVTKEDKNWKKKKKCPALFSWFGLQRVKFGESVTRMSRYA